jgi:photosystem II stability/assembly factor-like uncharacterized protein
MSVNLALVLLAALPLAQANYASASNDPGTPKARPRILAPEYPGAPGLGQIGEPPARRIQPDDVRLCDVSFVDPQHGWAVGDFGIILHTDDGGQHWSPQISGVTCTLNSVCFVDTHCGWAAGGIVYPFLHNTSGVVLATRDGGVTWQREPALLPMVRKIRFLTERQGWAIACPSAMFPGGAFISRDAGRSWQPASSGGTLRLSTGDFFDARNAILGGSLGLTAEISDGDFARRRSTGLIAQGINAMQVVPPGYGWLAGDAGWIALTADRGKSWLPPLGPIPPGARLFDFSALSVRGGKCWIAGSPGSRVFFTPDAGRSWSAFSTGTTAPLRAITFADDLHGWAVGQLGLILSTQDGGRTWRRQRSGGGRAAVMALAGAPQALPLELLARICKEQGYLGVAEVLGRTDVDPGAPGWHGDAPPGDRLHQALLHVGACAGETAWELPVRSADLRLSAQAHEEGWNRIHGGHGMDALLGRIVRQIRVWRPSVVLIPAAHDGDGLSEIVQQTAVLAVKKANDPTFMAELFQPAGCEPWKIEQAYLVSESNSSGKVALVSKDWSTRLGQTWADVALPARALLANDDQRSPSTASVQLVGEDAGTMYSWSAAEMLAKSAARSRKGDVANRFDLMAGVSTTDGQSRRTIDEAKGSFGGTLDGLAHGRRLEAALQDAESDPETAFARLLKGEELPPGIDAAAAAVMTYRMAARFRESGRRDLAEKTLAMLSERYPDDPLAPWALLQRFQSLAAGEYPQEAASERRPTIRAVSATVENAPLKSRGEQAVALARDIEINRPDLFALPAVRYPLAAVYRQLGKDSMAQRLYALDQRGVDRDAWCDCARGETWLLDRKGPAPKPMATCVFANNQPHLDGRLDEEIWKKCTPVALKSPAGDDGAWPATVRLAHDDQYLYLAIQCRQATGARYEAARERRQRDPDLRQHDRVDIFLDTDRNYATYYHLAIDHRGWAADAICGDRSWNPQWFVAAQTADGAWSAEAAIPLAELRATILPGKTVWALGLQRTVPGVGFQSWTTPAATEVVPEGFGWLGFD